MQTDNCGLPPSRISQRPATLLVRLCPPAFSIRRALGLAALLIPAVLAVGTGCQTTRMDELTRSEIIIRSGTNMVIIRQPKDVVIERAQYDPDNGRFTLEGYTSAVNATAVGAARAQTEAIAGATERSFAQGVQSAERVFAARFMGAPSPAGPATTNGAAIPANR